jgi:hypothetical protein
MLPQHVKIIVSGDMLELYEYEKCPNTTRLRVPRFRRNRGVGAFDGLPRIVRHDNARRQKSNFKRLCWANLQSTEPPVFFTFTFAEFVDIASGYKKWNEYIRVLRKTEGKTFSYIVVPEFGTKGTKRLHFHALFWGLNSAKCYSEKDTRYFAGLWSQGYLDCFPTDGSPRLGSYFAKYMHKALMDSRMLGQKAYRASRNILRSQNLNTNVQISYFQELYGIPLVRLSTVEPLLEKEYKTEWLGKGRFRLYNLLNLNENNLNQ